MPSQSPPPRNRSHSRSPRREERRRSRSPGRAPRTKNFSGLKWKGASRRDDRDDRDDRDRRDFRDRDRNDRGFNRHFDRDSGFRSRDWDNPNRGQGRLRDRENDRDKREQRRKPRREGEDKDKEREKKEDAPAAPAAAAPAAVPGQQMIIVTVNDRLGTKAQIPCLPSDPVKVFKAMVAARIGRPAHEIMLKRQGERPFKDQLTLEDYGVSNGVQIDLELDTGD